MSGRRAGDLGAGLLAGAGASSRKGGDRRLSHTDDGGARTRQVVGEGARADDRVACLSHRRWARLLRQHRVQRGARGCPDARAAPIPRRPVAPARRRTSERPRACVLPPKKARFYILTPPTLTPFGGHHRSIARNPRTHGGTCAQPGIRSKGAARDATGMLMPLPASPGPRLDPALSISRHRSHRPILAFRRRGRSPKSS